MAVGLFLLPTTLLFVVAPLYSPDVSYAGSTMPAHHDAPAQEEELKAPGDCTVEEHKFKQAIVDTVCNVPRACNASDSCLTLQINIPKLELCRNARRIINTTCFRGGNRGHKRALQSEEDGIKECNRLVTKRTAEGRCKIDRCREK